ALQDNLREVRKRVLDEQNAFAVAAQTVRQALERVKNWTAVPNKWSSVGDGLAQVYCQARTAFEAADADPTVATLHEWRKQAKYVRYGLEVLRPLWPERMEELANEADRMSGILGDDHDLAVLRETLTDEEKHLAEGDDLKVLLALIDRRR